MRDSVAIITGASRGIGRATALLLAREGADVVCAARTTDATPSRLPGTVEETAREIEALGRRALAVACDVSDEAQVARLVERTVAEFGRIDLLINNAAISALVPFLETTPKLWDLVMRVNLRGTYLCTRAVLPYMIEQGRGRIVNVSSGAVTDLAITARLGVIAYAVSKAGIEKLTETLAIDLQPKGIAVNCLRIEAPVATEGARMVSSEVDLSEWMGMDVVTKALRWLAARGLDYTGHIVTVAETQAAG